MGGTEGPNLPHPIPFILIVPLPALYSPKLLSTVLLPVDIHVHGTVLRFVPEIVSRFICFKTRVVFNNYKHNVGI